MNKSSCFSFGVWIINPPAQPTLPQVTIQRYCPMNTSPNIESRLTIEGTTLNAVNNTSGGAILQFNGPPTPGDYDQIISILANSSNGRPCQ